MKKFLLKIGTLFCIGLGFYSLASAALTANDVNNILNNLVQLTGKLADPQTGLPTKLDKLNESVTKIKLFNKCKELRAQKPDYNFALSAKNVKVSCGNYKDVLEAAQIVLDFVRKDAVGTSESLGVLYLILDILKSAGIKDVEKIQKTINDINTMISNITEILDSLKDAKVKETTPPAPVK